jgi:chemosensory pili system protein ChpA (sensor histidine kinase/response regulator)
VLDSGVPEQPQVPDLASLSPVEVAQGDDLGDLIVGETAAEALNPAREVHDLAGFKPAETESTRPPPAGGKELVGFQMGAEDIDEEIREVFVEEVQEEIDNLRQLLPLWQAKPEDFEALKPIRRVFHTLKGSGRLVGALVLGEFAWKIENMLNRVLDNSIAPRPEVLALVAAARDVLPELLCALRGEPGRYADLGGVQDVADALATGQVVEYRRPSSAVASDPIAAETSAAQVQAPADALHELASTSTSDAADIQPVEATEADEHELIALSETDAAAIEALLAGAAGRVDVLEESGSADQQDASSSTDVVRDELADADVLSGAEAVGEAVSDPFVEDLPALSLEEFAEQEAKQDSDRLSVDSEALGESEAGLDDLAVDWAEAGISSGLQDTSEVEGDLVLIDSDLFEILKAEVAGHLDTVEVYLQQSSAQPLPVHEALLRAVHTISGAFAMTEVEVGTELAWPLEGYIKRLLAQAAAPSAVGFECIEEAAQALRALMIELDQPLPRPQRHSRLALRISALRDALPEPTRPVIDVGVEDEAAFQGTGTVLSADAFALASAASDSSAADAQMAPPADAGADSAAVAPAEEALGLLGELPSDSEFDLLAASGELSFASEFESAEPFDPEAQAQSADIEIIETEGASTSPYWTETGALSVQPGVESGLTLDELGEASEAEAWLAAFEAEVAGEPQKTSGAPGLQTEVELSDLSESEDALLIHGLLDESAAASDASDRSGQSAPGFEAAAAAAVDAAAVEFGTNALDSDDLQVIETIEVVEFAELASPDAATAGHTAASESDAAPDLAHLDVPLSADTAFAGVESPAAVLGDAVSEATVEDAAAEQDDAGALAFESPAAIDLDGTELELTDLEVSELETIESEAIELGVDTGRVSSEPDVLLDEQGFESEGYPAHLDVAAVSSEPTADRHAAGPGNRGRRNREGVRQCFAGRAGGTGAQRH